MAQFTIPTTSRWIKAAIILLLVGLLLYIIGFATISWLFVDNNRESFEIGLWKVRKCTGDYCITGSSGLFYEDWFKACQALETLGLIALLLAFIILFLYMFVESCRGRNALMAIMMCTFAGVAFVVIGVIIFNTKKGYQMYNIGWSMGLAIAGAIFSFIAGIMVVMGYLGK